MKDYDWLVKKTPRSIDQLRLWPQNPRLNPEENHVQLSDYADDLISDESEKNSFIDLIKSISEDGFIPFDPVVVWQNEENGKFYVAEGNRRVLALKLLKEPHKAPKSIRGTIRKYSAKSNLSELDKISVNVAPTFDEAEWYINQRNSSSSLQRPWSRVQQQRWISELYDKYAGDIDKITSITKMTQGKLEDFIRILKIKDLIKEEEVKSKLTSLEFEEANSIKFPMTILERFFSNPDIRKAWGLDYDGINIKIISNRESFFNAFSELILRIIYRNTKYADSEVRIDTRTITSNFDKIFDSFPQVSFENPNEQNPIIVNPENLEESVEEIKPSNSLPAPPVILKNDENRNKLILSIYEVNTDSVRIKGLFDELKKVSHSYNNCIAASLRVFLDLTVHKYIETENLKQAICTQYNKGLKEITLSQRIEYIKQHKLNGKPQNIAQKLNDPATDFSLDVLNGFIHSQEAHYLNKQFLNRFWDFLFPLFQTLLDIKEKNV